MATPHKHAELIKAWADGAVIEARFRNCTEHAFGPWQRQVVPTWNTDGFAEYRVKPLTHKWQKEMEAYYLQNKDIECRSLLLESGRWALWSGRAPSGTFEKPDSGFSNPRLEFRIKPEKVVREVRVQFSGDESTAPVVWQPLYGANNLKLTFEDGKLVGSEVLK
jgi:hypothetical protein